MGTWLVGKNGNDEFRANVWSWRAILHIVTEVNKKENLNLNLDGWAYNEGGGLKTQTECDRLADALERDLQTRTDFKLPSDSNISDGGMQQLIGKLLAAGLQVNRSEYYTAHEHISELVKFLRASGGFGIY